ncbi:MAG: HNH endonuclease [Clostridia bacterium]|nr:HNH endonuclease [Clostridia bacterium]
MKFELNDYHRNVSNDELIADVIDTANRLGKSSLTADSYSQNGKYHSCTLIRRFGSWKKVLELSSLETQGHNFKKNITEADVIAELHRIADILGKDSITVVDFENHSKMCSLHALHSRFGTWGEILKLAGMESKNLKKTDEELYEEIERLWILLGRQPTYTDMRKGISKYSPRTFENHFGSWRGALESFVKYINNENDEPTVVKEVVTTTLDVTTNKEVTQEHTTTRNINLRLRFLVMKRDNFKCCMCGASPAKDPSVELHIDHILPWSKGGETTIDNLQTLCLKCNLGKSNLTQ